MAKVYCLKVPAAIKTLTLRYVPPSKKENKASTSGKNAAYMDLAGNCFTNKPDTGIIIGGYIIWEAGADGPDEPQIRY
ncbi:hypothetical protein [Adhaeribacter pallidiroseus]|uniref:Uncharacterized protein n=1 Tax=Adhaeribacter pallidiroseus TaxID=2072847 RepID=A0A369QQ15_9BACT|nr:hypothetical protein [Adhaeribacter pallidiroseus]RDC65376.1 hypothetical protein AHMF7616_04006 [Adhaeribacter pallidiroseus]